MFAFLGMMVACAGGALLGIGKREHEDAEGGFKLFCVWLMFLGVMCGLGGIVLVGLQDCEINFVARPME